MKIRCVVVLFTLAVSSMPLTLLAQDYDYHPALSDNFTASLGAMRSTNSFKFSAKETGPGDFQEGNDIDFDDNLGVSNSSTFFNGQLRWKFGSERKWSIWGQYFSNNASGNATLREDVEWNDIIFENGTYVEAGAKLAVTRVFVGRSFVKNQQHDFGAGIGIHNLDLSAYIEGEARINGESSGVRKEKVGASQILPNLGSWYNFSPAKKWLVHGRVDWIAANIGDYDGGLWNVSAGVSYQVFRNVGIDFAWQYFNLHVDVDKTTWKGSANMTYNGPVLAVDFSW